MHLIPEVYELFNLVLEDENVFTRRKGYADDFKTIQGDILKQELLMSKARKFLLNDKIDFDDFSKLKKEHNETIDLLKSQLNDITTKLIDSNANDGVWSFADSAISQSFRNQDIEGKRNMIELFTPSAINPSKNSVDPIKIDEVLTKIVRYCDDGA
jgi:site-specific DNA recombinase